MGYPKLMVALILAASGYNAAESNQAAAQTTTATAPRPKAVDNPDGFLVEVLPGVWCGNSKSEPLLGATSRYCRNLVAATLRVENSHKPHVKLFTLRTSYIKPYPVTDRGSEVVTNDTEARVDCDVGKIWSLSFKAFDGSGVVIQTDVLPAPMALPADVGASHAKIVCREG